MYSWFIWYLLPLTFLPAPLFYFSSSDIYLYIPYISGYFWPLIISCYQLCHLLSFLCPATSMPWCNWIISTLSTSSLNIQTFPSFSIKSPSICYSSPLSFFISAFFIFSITLTTFSSLFYYICFGSFYCYFY